MSVMPRLAKRGRFSKVSSCLQLGTKPDVTSQIGSNMLVNVWRQKMNLKGRKVLVTGAGGFIGSHLVERLVELGANVHAFVRYNSRNDEGLLKEIPEEIFKSIKIIYGDLRELKTIMSAMKDVEVAFNLAALVGIPYSYIHPQEVIETNIIGTLNVLTAAKQIGVEKIVQTSTSEIYGSAEYIPIDERHSLKPQSPYSASKIGADAISLSFYYSFDLPVVIIRPFNAYGLRQSGRAVIPSITTQVLTKELVSLGNTNTTRDFTFVKDTVEGFIKVAESDNVTGEEINIGSGIEIKIRDIITKIVDITGRNVELIEEGQRMRPKKSEVDRLCADNAKAKKLLGWLPQYSFDEGLKLTVEWIKDNLDKYKLGEYEV